MPAKSQPAPANWKLMVAGTGFSLLGAAALSLWAQLVVALGAEPEAIIAADWLGPLLAIFCAAAWASRQSKMAGWKIGTGLALILVAVWLLFWCYVTARWNLKAWLTLSLPMLTRRHVVAWTATLLCGLGGGWFGSRAWRQQRAAWAFLWGLPFVGTAAAILLFGAVQGQREIADANFAPGASLTRLPTAADGTTARLLSFDLTAKLHFGIYDADSDDDQPFDDRNTTWLGQSIEGVWDKVQRREAQRGRRLLAMVNGGFFGVRDNWVAFHEAPILNEGCLHYDTDVLFKKWPKQAASLTERRVKGKPEFSFDSRSIAHVPEQEMALGGVRTVFIYRGPTLPPGMGGTKLRTSRTALVFNNFLNRLYLLSVRDPDGEAASLQQKKRGLKQTGGWDVSQVQDYLEAIGGDVALFDGGESTQLAWRGADGQVFFTRSGYTLARTVGYYRERPLRVVFPLLPPQMNGGVLNYFYITAQK